MRATLRALPTPTTDDTTTVAPTTIVTTATRSVAVTATIATGTTGVEREIDIMIINMTMIDTALLIIKGQCLEIR